MGDVVKLFVDHYNKKHEPALNAEDLHVKIVGGEHLRPDMLVNENLKNGDECYLMGEDAYSRPSAEPKPPAAAPYSAPSAPAQAAAASSTGSAASKAPAAAADDGKKRCKNFGCQRLYDPNGPPQVCVHHKAPPIFHETAKWWSCCPNSKAYDFDEFMAIPGCVKGVCTNVKQEGKTYLGGCDLRAENAPVRLDANAPKDAGVKLRQLRKGMVAMGVDVELFDTVYMKQMTTDKGNADKVCERFRARFAKLLNEAS